MEYSLVGDEGTKERFVQYMKANPAARNGWVTWDVGPEFSVQDDYTDPFREIAANFGLEVIQADPDSME